MELNLSKFINTWTVFIIMLCTLRTESRNNLTYDEVTVFFLQIEQFLCLTSGVVELEAQSWLGINCIFTQSCLGPRPRVLEDWKFYVKTGPDNDCGSIAKLWKWLDLKHQVWVCVCVCVPTEFVIHSLCTSDAQVMFLLKPAPTQYVCVCVWETAREKMYAHAYVCLFAWLLYDYYGVIWRYVSPFYCFKRKIEQLFDAFWREKNSVPLYNSHFIISVLQRRPPGLLRPSVRPLSFTNNAHGSLHKTCPCSRKWDHHACRVLPGSSRQTQPYTSPSAHSSMASAPCLICQI